MNLNNFVKRVKDLGLNMKTVSEGTGISSTVLSDWKNGKVVPTVMKLEKVADFLDCSVDYLIGRTDVIEVNTRKITFDELKELKYRINDVIDDYFNL